MTLAPWNNEDIACILQAYLIVSIALKKPTLPV